MVVYYTRKRVDVTGVPKVEGEEGKEKTPRAKLGRTEIKRYPRRGGTTKSQETNQESEDWLTPNPHKDPP